MVDFIGNISRDNNLNNLKRKKKREERKGDREGEMSH